MQDIVIYPFSNKFNDLQFVLSPYQADDSMQNMVIYPFSDGFNDYDFNRDKQIEYEEFVFSVMSQFPLGDPEELREPFIWADANGMDI